MNDTIRSDSAQEIEELRRRVKSLEDLITTLTRCRASYPPAHPYFHVGWLDYLFNVPSIHRVPPRDGESDEHDVPGYVHLVHRPHPWRIQLHLRGRNMTARHLVGAMKANGWTEEETANQYRLGVDAVREAVDYVERHADLLAAEAAIELFLLRKGGAGNGAAPVPR